MLFDFVTKYVYDQEEAIMKLKAKLRERLNEAAGSRVWQGLPAITGNKRAFW